MDWTIGRGNTQGNQFPLLPEALAVGKEIYKIALRVPWVVLCSPPVSVHRGQRNMAGIEEKSQSAPASPTHAEEKKAKPGAAWKEGETHVLPKNNLPVVFTAFMLCTFLAALDQVRYLPPSRVFSYLTQRSVRQSSRPHCRRSYEN